MARRQLAHLGSLRELVQRTDGLNWPWDEGKESLIGGMDSNARGT